MLKRSEIQSLEVERKRITDQQTIPESFNKYFVGIAENVDSQSKNNVIIDDDDIDGYTHFMEEAYICNKMLFWKQAALS